MIPYADFNPYGTVLTGETPASTHCTPPQPSGAAAEAAWVDVARRLLASLQQQAESNGLRLWSDTIEDRALVDGPRFIDVAKAMGGQLIDGPHIRSCLEGGAVADLASFCADVRCFLAVTLAYSGKPTDIGNMITPQIVAEQLRAVESLGETGWRGMPEDERWRCQAILDNLRRASESTHFFSFPVVTYYEKHSAMRAHYADAIATPVDLGTITVRLHTGVYTERDEFASDVHLMIANCLTYWGAQAHGTDENGLPVGHAYVACAKEMGSAFDAALAITSLPVITPSLSLGDRVRALSDSYYTPWRKAGDVGTVTKSDGRVVEVSWDAHGGKTTPFDRTHPLIDWQSILALM